MTVRSPLSPGPLADIMAVSLRSLPGPHLQSPYDAIALFGHACMVAVGFQLVGLGEEHRISEESSTGVENVELTIGCSAIQR